MSTSSLFDLNPAATSPVLVVGVGIMGAGIAQVAALAGHPVMLFDVRDGAADHAREQLAQTFATLVGKGKLAAEVANAALGRIQAISALDAAAHARVVVEAVVEKLDVKRALFRQLEGIVSTHCILATNTSSISVTAIANGLQHPQRVVGMHFFNPVPLMKLVEVVSGLQTAPAVADAIFALSQAWGKVAVHAKSTPGFIVNRIARPYYAETLALLQEQAATPAVLDACLRAVGFRMGPCELMDLIGHDTNFSVTQSVYQANFYDKRYQPSLVQQEMVDGGLLGRKSGRGFYTYPAPQISTSTEDASPPPHAEHIVVMGSGAVADHIAHALSTAQRPFERQPEADWVGLNLGAQQLRLTDGRTATELAHAQGLADVAVFDLMLPPKTGTSLAWAAALDSSEAWQEAAPAWLRLLGVVPQRLSDAPALVVARTVAMLINEAADAVHQGVCTSAGADAAMKLGVNYPAGPFEWLAQWHLPTVVQVLDALDAHYRGERYRVSPWLRLRAYSAQ